MAAIYTTARRRGTHGRDADCASPAFATGGADGPHRHQPLQLSGSLRPGGGAAGHDGRARHFRHAGGRATDRVHPDLRAGVPRGRRARRSPASVPSGGHRRSRLEPGHLRVGDGADVRRPGPRTRADRGGRGELHRRDPLAALGFLSARRGGRRAGALLRGHSHRVGRWVSGGRRGERALGWRAAFFVAGAPGAPLALVLLFFHDPPRGAHDRVVGGAMRPGPASRPSRALWARKASGSTRRPKPSTPSPWAVWRSGCRPTSCASTICRCAPPISGSVGCWWWRDSSGRWWGDAPATGWPRDARRSLRAVSAISLIAVAAVHADRGSLHPRLLSSGRPCS